MESVVASLALGCWVIMEIFMILLTTTLAVSASSFWSMWVSLEIFLFMLLPWLAEGESPLMKPSAFMYFLTQFIASAGFLIGSLTFINMPLTLLMILSMFLKVACFPFHSWFTKLIPNISWLKITILISASKLPPLMVLLLVHTPKELIWMLIVGMFLALGAYNTTCLRSLVAYSSVTHSSWLVISSLISKSLTITYFMMYVVMSVPVCLIFMKEKFYNLKTAFLSKKSVTQYLVLNLTLMGIPPFLGFFPKLLVMMMLTDVSSFMEAGLMGLLSVIPLYFYFKMFLACLKSNMYASFSFPQATAIGMAVTMVISSVLTITMLLSSSLLV